VKITIGTVIVNMMMRVKGRGDDTDKNPIIELEFVKLLDKESPIKKYSANTLTIPRETYENYDLEETEVQISLFKLDEEVPDDPAQTNLDENIKK
jgi:hypothetical protein